MADVAGPVLRERLSCDRVLSRSNLAPAGTGEPRTITPAQRDALAVRDRGCVIPDCTAAPQWCDGHDVLWWSPNSHSGEGIGSLALLCEDHHTQVHLGIWRLSVRDGVPWVQPPHWLDDQRRLVRNTHPPRSRNERPALEPARPTCDS